MTKQRYKDSKISDDQFKRYLTVARMAMLRQDMTVAELSEKMDMPVKTLRNIFYGERKGMQSTWNRIFDELNLTISEQKMVDPTLLLEKLETMQETMDPEDKVFVFYENSLGYHFFYDIQVYDAELVPTIEQSYIVLSLSEALMLLYNQKPFEGIFV